MDFPPTYIITPQKYPLKDVERSMRWHTVVKNFFALFEFQCKIISERISMFQGGDKQNELYLS